MTLTSLVCSPPEPTNARFTYRLVPGNLPRFNLIGPEETEAITAKKTPEAILVAPGLPPSDQCNVKALLLGVKLMCKM